MQETPRHTRQQAPSLAAEMDPVEQQGELPLDRLSFLAMIYLGIPVAMFFGGWLRLPFAIALLAVLVLGFIMVWRVTKAGTLPFRFELKHLFMLGVALIWVSCGGAGHLLYANRWDWSYRDAILSDLITASWPPGYDIGGPILWLLRCPLGYYLPAALGGKILGFSAADTVLWIWTVIGVWIFLSLLPIRSGRYGRMGVAILTVILFSGMDILGWWFLRGVTPPIAKHMEWWAYAFQYSSNTTVLFWTPNHALPAWIAAALFWKHWKTDIFITVSPFLLALLPIWSPFPVIGMMPFYALLLVRIIRENKWRLIDLPLLTVSVLMIFAAVAYMSMDIGGIPSDYVLNRISFAAFLRVYGLFVLFEFGILSVLIWKFGRGQIFVVAVVVLLALPFIRFGPGNDLVMRGSIPALAFLCFTTITYLQRATKERPGFLVAISVVLCLGAITPFHEFYRALTLPSWKPTQELTAMSFLPFPPPTYVARNEHTWRNAIFRDVSGIIKTSTSDKYPISFWPEELP